MEQEILKNHNFKEEILKKIKAGEVHMRPKAYFVVKIYLLVFVMFVTFIISVLLISYTLFSLRAGGQIFLLEFGSRGFYEFVTIFPWLLFIFDALLLIFLDYLLKRFRFGYNRPLLYLFLGTIACITMLGSLVNFTSFHEDLMRRAEGDGLPFAGGFYEDLRKSHKEQGLFRGIVVAVEGNTFLIEPDFKIGTNTAQIKVIGTINSNISNILEVGDRVFIAGDVVNSEIHAYGFKKLENND